MSTIRIASIGFGAMAQALRKSLAHSDSELSLQACLVRPSFQADDLPDIQWFTQTHDLISAQPELVVECATHEAVRTTVPDILEAGIDVIIASIGALADHDTLERITHAATLGDARVTVVSGAIGGLDVLRAAACAGLHEVTYVGRKPPSAWKGTPAEQLVDLANLSGPYTFYDGSATDAARDYPKNTNVTAAIALAGVGFNATRVKLIADPAAKGNHHELIASGQFGRFRITLENLPLPENPKTSWLAALSVEQAVRKHFSNIEV